jgi:hypothetical protein
VSQFEISSAVRFLAVSFAREEIMMEPWERTEAVRNVIKLAIDVARRNKGPNEMEPSDDLIAHCVVQELRRAGWSIQKISN